MVLPTYYSLRPCLSLNRPRQLRCVLALDSGALVAAIRRLQEEPEVATRWGQQGAIRVRQLLNLDRLLQDTLAVYREVMAARISR